MEIKTVSLMLEKINRTQWSKLMNFSYTFTPASSHQRIHPASKVIVEPRLFFSSCPVHCSLSHVWQIIPEYCNFLFQWIVIFTNAISLFLLFTRCFGNSILTPNSFKFGSHVQLSSQFFHFSMTDVFMVSKFFTTIPFLSPPFICMDRRCLQRIDFFDLLYLPNYLSCTYWLITSFCMRS